LDDEWDDEIETVDDSLDDEWVDSKFLTLS
jgi:hypothetical protein